jgi:anti-sigma B factor antagonist
MAFDAVLEMTPSKVAIITLTGELDATSADKFRAEIQKAATQEARRLVLMVKDLEYMASAGLRVLIFAKQKMGPGVDLYVVEPQEAIREVITMTGFAHSVIMLDQYNQAEIESV